MYALPMAFRQPGGIGTFPIMQPQYLLTLHLGHMRKCESIHTFCEVFSGKLMQKVEKYKNHPKLDANVPLVAVRIERIVGQHRA